MSLKARTLSGNARTGVGTLLASLGTRLAVISVVFGTLVGTLLANVGAKLADVIGVFAVLGHIGRRQATDLSALNIHAYALGHFVYFILLKALGSALVTIRGADMTSLDFFLERSKMHRQLL